MRIIRQKNERFQMLRIYWEWKKNNYDEEEVFFVGVIIQPSLPENKALKGFGILFRLLNE